MAQNIEAARARAEAIFKKADAQLGSGLITALRTTEELAAREKIARLRALRLAKEAGHPAR